MSDAGAMIARCWMRQHPECYGGMEITEVFTSSVCGNVRPDIVNVAGEHLSEEPMGWHTVTGEECEAP